MLIKKYDGAKHYICDFCGRHEDFVRAIVAGAKACICYDCAKTAVCTVDTTITPAQLGARPEGSAQAEEADATALEGRHG